MSQADGLRVLALHQQTWPSRGGDAVHVWAILSGLAARGWEVTTQGDAGPPGIKLVPWGRAGVLEALRETDVLYVRVDGGFAREKATFYARLPGRRVPVVWEVNASLEEQIERRVDPRRLDRWRRVRRLLARGADAALVISPELLGYVRGDLGFTDTTVVENGAQWPRPQIQASALRLAGPFRALWSGNATYAWQALDTAIAAARLIAAAAPEVVVAVMGSPDADGAADPSNLLRLTAGDSAQAAAHLAAANCSLCLYHDTPWAPGGFAMSPIKLFEAWATGVPVVATALGSLRRLVHDGETGLLVDDDPEAVAGAVVRLRKDPELCRRLAEAGLGQVREHYNWDRAADQVSDALLRAVARRRRTG